MDYNENEMIVVITLVVYFGPDEWDAPVSLEEMFSTDNKELQPFIRNYKINLITPRQMEDQEFEKFHSGLGAVLLCANHSKNRDLRVLEQPVYKQVDWKTARLIKEISAIDIDLDNYNKEGSVDMCEAYENTKRQMIAIGEKSGIAQGEMKKAKEMAINLRMMGISIDMIAKAANVSDSLVKQWLEIMTA